MNYLLIREQSLVDQMYLLIRPISINFFINEIFFILRYFLVQCGFGLFSLSSKAGGLENNYALLIHPV